MPPDTPRYTPHIAATRRGLPPICAPLEFLCLTHVADDKYRLYTTEAFTLMEENWDLDPVEFTTAYDPAVSLYLTESLWRLAITEHDLDQIVRNNTL